MAWGIIITVAFILWFFDVDITLIVIVLVVLAIFTSAFDVEKKVIDMVKGSETVSVEIDKSEITRILTDVSETLQRAAEEAEPEVRKILKEVGETLQISSEQNTTATVVVKKKIIQHKEPEEVKPKKKPFKWGDSMSFKDTRD